MNATLMCIDTLIRIGKSSDNYFRKQRKINGSLVFFYDVASVVCFAVQAPIAYNENIVSSNRTCALKIEKLKYDCYYTRKLQFETFHLKTKAKIIRFRPLTLLLLVQLFLPSTTN